MSRSTHISRLVAAVVAAVALAAPPALADPPQLRRDGYQLQNWRLLAQLEKRSSGPIRPDVDGSQPQQRSVEQPRGVVGPSVGYERPDSMQPQPRVSAAAAAPAASDGVDWLDATIGAAIGLALGLALFTSAHVARRRTRIAHS
jgi:hypothetical protein